VEGRDGLTLVDGGLGTFEVDNPLAMNAWWRLQAAPVLDRRETAFERVRALGYAPGDVRDIVVTHMDLDHAGCIPDFPWATVHLHSRELEAATVRNSALARRRYLPSQMPAPRRVERYADGGDTWRGLSGARPLRGRNQEIVLIPLPGHSAGHCGIAVHADRGWLFHAGDAYFFHGQIGADPWAPFALAFFQRRSDTNREQRLRNQAIVRELALNNNDVDVFCSHDAAEFDALAGRANQTGS
jgi:glyoxylase-like metal-dependent hydrolase (beta-lactamase superfamily II)